MRIILDMIREIPADLRRRADRRRAIAYGRQEELRRDGLPESYVKQQTELDLALAGFVDALSHAPGDAAFGIRRAMRAIRSASSRSPTAWQVALAGVLSGVPVIALGLVVPISEAVIGGVVGLVVILGLAAAMWWMDR